MWAVKEEASDTPDTASDTPILTQTSAYTTHICTLNAHIHTIDVYNIDMCRDYSFFNRFLSDFSNKHCLDTLYFYLFIRSITERLLEPHDRANFERHSLSASLMN